MSAKGLQIQVLLFVGVFVAALGSGMILGRGMSRIASGGEAGQSATTRASSQPADHDPRRRLASELGLTEEQQKRQKAIWDEAWETGRKQDEKRRAADKERDEEIVKVLSAEQRKAYDEIQARHAASREQLNRERDEAFKKAQEEFKKLLTADQLVKYEEIVKNRPPRRGGRGGPSTGPGGRGSETRPVEGRGSESRSEKGNEGPRP